MITGAVLLLMMTPVHVVPPPIAERAESAQVRRPSKHQRSQSPTRPVERSTREPAGCAAQPGNNCAPLPFELQPGHYGAIPAF